MLKVATLRTIFKQEWETMRIVDSPSGFGESIGIPERYLEDRLLWGRLRFSTEPVEQELPGRDGNRWLGTEFWWWLLLENTRPIDPLTPRSIRFLLGSRVLRSAWAWSLKWPANPQKACLENVLASGSASLMPFLIASWILGTCLSSAWVGQVWSNWSRNSQQAFRILLDFEVLNWWVMMGMSRWAGTFSMINRIHVTADVDMILTLFGIFSIKLGSMTSANRSHLMPIRWEIYAIVIHASLTTCDLSSLTETMNGMSRVLRAI